MAQHYDFGRKAENEAILYLKNKGYDILVCNYRFQKAEIDIIAKTKDFLVIVEVKARSTDFFLEPQEAVISKKRKLLIMAADAYVTQHNLDVQVRFDIVAVLKNLDGTFRINHIENAFDSIE